MTFLLIAQTGSTQSSILANGKRLYTSFVNWQAFCRVCWWVVNCAAVRRLAGSVNIEEGSQRLCAAARARTTWLEVDRRASENTVELALSRPSLEVAPIVSVSAAFSCRHRTLRSCELRWWSVVFEIDLGSVSCRDKPACQISGRIRGHFAVKLLKEDRYTRVYTSASDRRAETYASRVGVLLINRNRSNVSKKTGQTYRRMDRQ